MRKSLGCKDVDVWCEISHISFSFMISLKPVAGVSEIVTAEHAVFVPDCLMDLYIIYC